MSVPQNSLSRDEVVIDAKGQILGRLAVQIANILRGKDRPSYDPSRLSGRRVLVTNAQGILVTGRKALQKVKYHHTQWPRGLRSKPLWARLSLEPERVIADAVRGMLPKNRLRTKLMKRLTVVRGVPEITAKKEK